MHILNKCTLYMCIYVRSSLCHICNVCEPVFSSFSIVKLHLSYILYVVCVYVCKCACVCVFKYISSVCHCWRSLHDSSYSITYFVVLQLGGGRKCVCDWCYFCIFLCSQFNSLKINVTYKTYVSIWVCFTI